MQNQDRSMQKPWQKSPKLSRKSPKIRAIFQQNGWRFACFALLIALVAPFAHAQYRASIQGTVTDTSGAVIPGATLVLTDLGTNEKQTRTSNEAGIFSFNALPPDTFSLVVTRDGFQKKVLDKLQLIPEQANAVNVQLQIGGATSTVTVDASTAPALDTATANIGRSISENEVQHMPTFQRDVTSLIQLAPGVLADGSQSGGGGGFQAPGTQTNASSGGGGNLGHSSSIFATENGASANANGGQFENNGYLVDGISTGSVVWGGSTVVTPSEDSVANVKIVTNAYDAENGRFSGALTEITSKSGTNDVHGSFFYQINRPGLNAYQRWNGSGSVATINTDGSTKTPVERGLLRDEDRYNQLGGSIGGPIWKNRIFAFFDYEGQSQTVPATGTGWYLIPSNLATIANSSSLASTYLNYAGAGVLGTLNTSTSCAVAQLSEGVNCRTITGQGINVGSPLTNGLGKQDPGYVDTTDAGIGNGLTDVADVAEYTTQNPTSVDLKQYNGRLDADVTAKDHASFAIYWVPTTKTTYNGGIGYQLLNHDQVNDAFSAIWNHIFSPTFLNEARANAAGYRYNEEADNPQAPFGLPQDTVLQFGAVSLGYVGTQTPSILNQWTYGYKDVATKVLRTQTIKFGGDYTQLRFLNFNLGTPNYSFYNLWDFLNDAPESEGGSFQATTGIPGSYRNDNRQNLFGGFVQDDWKARPNLTLSVGLRYSYFGPLTDKDKNMSTLTFGSGADLLTGITLKHGIGAWKAQKWNFGPEVGFNWAPLQSHDRIVFRGGYGLNYNQQQIATANADDNNPPGTNGLPGSTKLLDINPNIIYALSSSPTNVFGYPANPNAITTFNSAGLPTVGGANLNSTSNPLPTEYEQHYSLEMEWDLTHSWVANVGYQGSNSHHTLYNYDANALGDILGAPLNPLVNAVSTFGSQGKANNNMLLAGAKHQFSHTFSLEGQFTWAHSMDTDSGPYTRDAYLYNPKYSYGRSDFDVNKSFKLFGVWQPVLFHGGHQWAEKVAGGWTLTGIFTIHSGYGWTPVYTAAHQIYCFTCNYGYQSLRPTYKGGVHFNTSSKAFETGSNFPGYDPNTKTSPTYAQTGTNNNLFDNTFFSVPDYSAAITDSAGEATNNYVPAPGIDRNQFPGPLYRNVDITLAKAFGLPHIKGLGSDPQIEVKANFFNILNLLNIDPTTIQTNIGNANLGQATAALGSRMVNFQARFNF